MFKEQVEINDLIGHAVKNAVARRHEVIDLEDALSALSDEEARSIAGTGLKPSFPLITVGLIASTNYPIA